MSKKPVGTNSLAGLNVALASHKIDDSELTVSENGWTDEEGVWRTMPGPTVLYTGYSNIRAMAAGRMGGADHVVWLDGTTLYDNGASKGTLATTAPVIRDFDDKFFIMGADDGKNYVYDGNHLREAGAWQPVLNGNSNTYLLKSASSVSYAITAVADGVDTVLTIGAHAINVGDWVYISGVVGMVELNGLTWEVTDADATTITIAADSTSFASWSSAGTVYKDGCGLDGVYKFYFTCIVKLGDGSVLEGTPRGLRTLQSRNDSLEAEAFDIDPTDTLNLGVLEWFDHATYGTFEITGTYGVDYFPGFRVYRTKAGGTDYYLNFEYYYGDGTIRGTSGSNVYYQLSLVSGLDNFGRDGALGAVYTPGSTDRSSHPASSVMASAAQRIWLNNLDEPYNLFYTHLDGTDYVPLLNFLRLPDDITAIGPAGDVVVAFSSDRMWRASLLGGLPDVDEIKTPVGTTYGNALALTDLGLLFLRDDGLWATDGASPPSKVSRRAFATLTGPLSVAAYGDTLVVMGTDEMYVMRRRDGGSYWHGPAVAYTHLDATGGTFYAADANSIYTLFTGPRLAGAMETKDFWLGGEAEATRVVVDCSGSVSVGVMVEGNRDSDYDLHEDDGTDRRLVRYPIPRLVNHVARVRVEASGEAAVYGVWLEVNR